MRHTRRVRAAGAVVVIVLIAPGATVSTQQTSPRPADLVAIFSPGDVLQERNGDGFVDFVNARIVLGERPGAAEVSAGADVAARLGFETMAMDLPILSNPDDLRGAMPFIIGSDAARRMGVALPAGATPGPGEGMVITTTARDRPAVLVIGGDGAGTMAAAELLAGRLPHLWDPKGPTLVQVVEDVKTVLTGGGVAATSVSIPAVAVRADQDEIRSINVSVGVQNPADAAKAAALLRGLRDAARTEKQRLSYPGAASIRIDVAASGTKPAFVELPRVEGPKRGPAPPRPGSDAKEKFTLANLYTTDGLLGDSDTNRI